MITFAKSLNISAIKHMCYTSLKFKYYFASFKPNNTLLNMNKLSFGQIKQSKSQLASTGQIKNGIKNETDILSLIEYYQKQQNMSTFQGGQVLLKIMNEYRAKGIRNQQCQKIQQILTKTLQKFVQQLKSTNLNSGSHVNKNFNMMLKIICLKTFPLLVNKVSSSAQSRKRIQLLIQDQAIINTLLINFNDHNFRHRSNTIKFVMQNHQKNTNVVNKLQQILQQNKHTKLKIQQISIQQMIYYLRQLIKYTQKCTQQNKNKILNNTFIQQCINMIYLKIMIIKPKQLYILTQILQKLNKNKRYKQIINVNIILTAVQQHMKGIKMLQAETQFINDYINFIQILQNISKIQYNNSNDKLNERIKVLVIDIYKGIKNMHKGKVQQTKQHQQKQKQQKQKEDSQEIQYIQQQNSSNDNIVVSSSNKQLRIPMIKVNIILGSMLKLITIDAQLFQILQSHLFANLNSSNYQNIRIYLYQRIRIVRTAMESLRQQQTEHAKIRARLIKQEHTKFILKILTSLQQNRTLNLVNILDLLKICQSFPVKSREIKRKLKALTQLPHYKPDLNHEVQALAEIIIQAY